ncbi:MAG TPA: SDR family oxidoreductase [Terriglobales bacterium]|nr:SDR family oxidoreductase [Terriglobales bacterium]
MKELKGKAVLVTGGAKRIGREIALTLARAGADVAITYLGSEKQARATVTDLASLGVRSLALRCDVRQEKSAQAAVKEVRRELGGLDVLVNNAGTYETVDFDKITVAQWDEMFATNTRGPFLVARAAAKLLRARQGRIINLGSLGGLRPWVEHAHYCASKAALTMLTEVMAKALAPEIAVNSVAPGMISLGESKAEAFFKQVAAKTPMKRAGRADEVAAAVRFFASAPHFITGTTLVVDGGLGLT